MTWYCDLVLTPRHCALDHDTALCFRGILILPARQAVNTMPARQHNIDVGNLDITVLITLATTLVFTIVITAFLHPVAWFGAINSPVKTIRMTLVHTRVSAWKTLTTKTIASGLR